MKRPILYLLLPLLLMQFQVHASSGDSLKFFAASHSYIQYTGRIDFTNRQLPRFWQPGVYITFRFRGTSCEIILNDEMLWGSFHNYIEIVVDGKVSRIQTKTKRDTIRVGENLQAGIHTIIICKKHRSQYRLS